MGLIAGASTVVLAKLNGLEKANNANEYTRIYKKWVNEKNVEPEVFLSQSTIREAVESSEIEDLIIDDFHNNRVFIIDGLVLSEVEGALVATLGAPI